MAIKFDESTSVVALPTPPHSPSQHSSYFAYGASQLVSHHAHIHQIHHANPHPHHKQTTTLLDSLTSFYQQEQCWVHHTRAALELTVTKGIDGPEPHLPLTGSSHANVELSPATAVACSPVRVKAEPDTEHAALASPPLEPGATALQHQQHASRWLRRKNRMRLHLAGISPTNPHRRRRPAKAPATEPAAQLLEMFAELVDARMESCVRMERLVRESGRGCAVC
ncbi:hypothetical protein PHLGIDRAFT_383709 [Phlebiopsis gigantea 11061_1 CR5-6]|uniref:Uncharacterized protein n=1 Tax=Phlebiopsis gigantea (strain 11061_1 CR5-6) TaxID=745531 RepID=A0A0C3S9K2_PHLG1|nr:hypothetical protein PHLGIDRAFT_383709 [Phlebiopsis gigantea 11061_1 CR5-6]